VSRLWPDVFIAQASSQIGGIDVWISQIVESLRCFLLVMAWLSNDINLMIFCIQIYVGFGDTVVEIDEDLDHCNRFVAEIITVEIALAMSYI
jgi:hypothetical protein